MRFLKSIKAGRLVLLAGVAGLLGIAGFAFAGVVPPIPTGPFDANGNPSVPDYYTTANWANSPSFMRKFVNTLPKLGVANDLGNMLTVAVPDTTTYPGSDYYEIELREYSQKLHSDLNPTLLRGYVQINKGTNITLGSLPSENKCGVDAHACTADDTAVTGKTPAAISYMGPTIVAERDRPVRIKFTNKLPAGSGGDLFIPVDKSVMGAGTGPAAPVTTRGVGIACDNTVEPNSCASYPENRAAIHLHGGRTPWISDGTPHQWITPADEITPFTRGVSLQNVPDMPDPGDGSTTYYYTNEQSARLMFYHDHAFGITRLNVYVGEAAGYVITDKYEKDLVDRGLIPSDQIPLIIQDKTFVDATPTVKKIYNPATGLFDTPITVPKVRETDPLWNWGSGQVVNGVREPVTGDLWMSHVYMPAQNSIAGSGGVNPFGRWMYGPWFYPATVVKHGPVANPYYDQDCSSPFPNVYLNCTTPGQPTMIPGTPHPSMGMEAFQDTAMVNGTPFPTLTVDPRAYRFRILNAASDRFQNLSFYVADSVNTSPAAGLASNQTEVKMADAAVSNAIAGNWPADWPVDGRPEQVPDPGTCTNSGTATAPVWNCTNWGPKFLQIGTEGGFLPQPVEINPQPITYITDPTAFWVGIVDKMGLALGPAERADVIVDFSAYANKTLILYNDAPAAWPARVPGYDYYTGAPDMRDSGGFGQGGTWNEILGVWEGGRGPDPGYAPNTRTVMQIIVRGTTGTDPVYSFSRSALEAEFKAGAPATSVNPADPVTTQTKTLFERSQDPIIVGQEAYSTTYPNSYFPPNYPWEGINQINDHFLQFVTLDGSPVKMTTEPKGIHDEMGASFDPDYGRMSGNLAMQLPNPTTLNALLVLYGFSDIPTEVVNNSPTVNVQVLGNDPALIPWQVTDGTQIWKISHNGVDTHPIHFHIFDVQLINRVGWDGQIKLPEPNELGWKDTIKISPLMDTIVAVRPRAPLLPFGIPKSLRPLNPAIPMNSAMGFNQVDWTTGQARRTPVTNVLYDFGWEYVWHCHILNHEEMDMMRPIVLNVMVLAPAAPTQTTAATFTGNVNVTWTDPTPATMGDMQNEVGFIIERCARINDVACTNFTQIGKALANATSYVDTTATTNPFYSYRVIAYNAAGNSPASNVISTTTTAAINGVCGASDGGIFISAPTTELCTAGTSGAVTYAAPTWSWTCSGLNSGASANCSANLQNYVLTYNAAANGSVVSGSTVQVVYHGANAATVTAAPNTAFSFVSWTDMSGAIVSLLPGYTATNVTANNSYTANFYMKGDFNGDGNFDILWTNTVTGANSAWIMGGTNGISKLAEVPLPASPGAGWAIVAKGDFNNDGKTDIVWRNDATGQITIWYMNGVNYLGQSVLPTFGANNWKIVGAGDFNGDGKTDLLLRRASTGTQIIWYLNYSNGNNTVNTSASLPTYAVNSTDWNIVGVGDFNKDGKPDILWRQTSTGKQVLWYTNNNTVTGSVTLSAVFAANSTVWSIVGVGDFNKDGNPDVLWRNYSTGKQLIWFMNNATVSSSANSPDVLIGAQYTIVGR